jgi:allantoin racemase
MRILFINPNTSPGFTDKVAAIAGRRASSGTQVIVANSNAGPRSIESVYDELLSAPGTLQVALERIDEYDALVIACYSDHPTVYALREVTDKPVVGIAEASMLYACILGHRFSVVTTNQEWEPLLWDAVRHYGLAERCASVRSTGMAVLELESADSATTERKIIDAARLAVTQDGADVICLGCAGMAGLDDIVSQALGVPVIDGVVAALKLIEGALSAGWRTSKRLAYARPHHKDLDNLPEIFLAPYHRPDASPSPD